MTPSVSVIMIDSTACSTAMPSRARCSSARWRSVTSSTSEATPTDELPADVPTLRKPFDQATLAAALATLLGPEPGAAGGVEAASPTAPAADGQPQSPITNTTTEPRPQ